jgi:hypothetical protein
MSEMVVVRFENETKLSVPKRLIANLISKKEDSFLDNSEGEQSSISISENSNDSFVKEENDYEDISSKELKFDIEAFKIINEFYVGYGDDAVPDYKEIIINNEKLKSKSKFYFI